jgi:hypothetical protein
MKSMLLAASMAAAMFAGSAQAVVLYESDPFLTTAIGAAAPLGITPSLGSENGGYGGGLLTGPIGFETDSPTKLTITVKDLGFTFAESTEDEDSVDKVDLLPNLVPNGEVQPVELSLPGSRYEVILDGESLGATSEPGVNGWSFSFSEGVFHANVIGGLHSLDLWNFILTFAGDFFPVEDLEQLALNSSFAKLSSDDELCGGECDEVFLVDLLGSNVYVKIEATAPIPEPSTYATLALGLIALAVAMARRKRVAAASAH